MSTSASGDDLPRLPVGAATGVGSLPGTDPDEAARVVAGELPDLPHVPELPDRGAGADLVGRSAAQLDGLAVDLQPAGWRLLGPRGRAGRDVRRAASALSRDLDALEEALDGYAGPLKAQLCGPWTLAAALELPGGGPALGDAGAVRDVTGALAETAAAHVAALRRRVPGAHVLLQVDEPSLPAVLGGAVPTASGFSRVRPVAASAVREGIADVVDAVTRAGGLPVVHCCAARPPVRLLAATGARALSLDATLLEPRDDDDLGEALEAGVGLLAGLVATRAPGAAVADAAARTDASRRAPRRTSPSPPSDDAAPVRDLWHRLGLPAADLPHLVTVTPTCGLAGTPPRVLLDVLRRTREVARVLAEAPEG